MQTISFDVRGMTCGGCSGNGQRVLGKFDGVSRAEVSLRHSIATLVPDPVRVMPVQIESAIAKLGNTTNVRPADYDEKAQP